MNTFCKLVVCSGLVRSLHIRMSLEGMLCGQINILYVGQVTRPTRWYTSLRLHAPLCGVPSLSQPGQTVFSNTSFVATP